MVGDMMNRPDISLAGNVAQYLIVAEMKTVRG